jgi:triosephosphate isomerase
MVNTSRQTYVIGNWKMHGHAAESKLLVSAIAQTAQGLRSTVTPVICPPYLLVPSAHEWLKDSKICLGGQDCHWQQEGAFTGDVSAKMLKDAGCSYVIVGHSERRQYHGETDAEVARKTAAARDAGLAPVVCVGEDMEIREQGNAESLVAQQVLTSLPETYPQPLIIAYEPIWAIGTGKTASLNDISSMHAAIKQEVAAYCKWRKDDVHVLYGGSVKPGNAEEILRLPEVDGVLVGGASLKAEQFTAILAAA